MKSYIGTKIVNAEPREKVEDKMTPSGMATFKTKGYMVVYEDGYESWSPKEVFERCYREITDQEKAMVK